MVPQVEAFGPDAMVCLHSGWDTKYGTAAEYAQYPFLSLELAHALVELQVRMLALDTPSPDMPDGPRPPHLNWPVHRVLMEGGVLITEQVTRLDLIRGRRFRLHALPIALARSDGTRTSGRRTSLGRPPRAVNGRPKRDRSRRRFLWSTDYSATPASK